MGSRSLRYPLSGAGIPISRDRVRWLMRNMCIHALYRKLRTTMPEQRHKIYPNLLWDLAIKRLIRSGVLM